MQNSNEKCKNTPVPLECQVLLHFEFCICIIGDEVAHPSSLHLFVVHVTRRELEHGHQPSGSDNRSRRYMNHPPFEPALDPNAPRRGASSKGRALSARSEVDGLENGFAPLRISVARSPRQPHESGRLR
jgi:hypothetical protein